MKKNSLNCTHRIFLVVIVLVVSLLAVEGGFRLYLLISGKEVPRFIKIEEVFEKTWFVPHPYLIYTFKPNSKFVANNIYQGEFTINKFGFRSTLEYDVKSVTRPANTLRIATLGGSTVMGLNNDDKVWPYLLGKLLDERVPDKEIEVLNEGLMGYTSLENLADLSMRVIDFNPDVYIIYLGINDYLTLAPAAYFKTDYSHFRKTFWETISFSIVELVPGVLLRSKVLSQVLLSSGVKDRRNLLDNTGTNIFRYRYKMKKNEYYPAREAINAATIRNVKSMIGIIRQHNPEARIILSSFFNLENPYWILRLNKEFAALARGSAVEFVDAVAQMPKEKRVVYDQVHFNLEGESRMAEIFAGAIAGGR